MADAGFPKQSRLLSSKDFSPVFDKPDYRLSSRHLLILGKNAINGECARIGLVIGKKHVRKAVQRNRIKRILRESFRLKKNGFATIDLVFLARPQMDSLSNHEIRSHCDRLLSQLLNQRTSQQLNQKPGQSGKTQPSPAGVASGDNPVHTNPPGNDH